MESSAPDIFDTNKYAHDPRNDFLNWALVDTGTFDYAADAWAFTYGTALEWYEGPWTYRVSLFDDPIVPNSTELDPTFTQYQVMGEIERRYELNGQPGKIAVTGFLTRARLGRYGDAVQLAEATGGTPSVAAVRHYTEFAVASASMPNSKSRPPSASLPELDLLARISNKSHSPT